MFFVANLLVSATLAILSHNIASADAFDDKAQAAAAQQAQINRDRAFNKSYHLINRYNSEIVHRVRGSLGRA